MGTFSVNKYCHMQVVASTMCCQQCRVALCKQYCQQCCAALCWQYRLHSAARHCKQYCQQCRTALCKQYCQQCRAALCKQYGQQCRAYCTVNNIVNNVVRSMHGSMQVPSSCSNEQHRCWNNDEQHCLSNNFVQSWYSRIVTALDQCWTTLLKQRGTALIV